jgi:hypothetical protein
MSAAEGSTGIGSELISSLAGCSKTGNTKASTSRGSIVYGKISVLSQAKPSRRSTASGGMTAKWPWRSASRLPADLKPNRSAFPIHGFRQFVFKKGGSDMALIPAQIKKIREAVTIKLEKSVIEQLKLYATFIDSTQEHVVNEALALTFRKDKEFQDWLEKRGIGGVRDDASV